MCTGANAMTLDSTQNKLLLLFVFDKMEIPLSEDTILDLCCHTNNWISYIDCKQALAQLIEASFIYRINNNSSSEPLFTITPEGRVCLAHCFVRIPSSLREVVSENIKVNRMSYRRRQEYFSDYHKNADGTYDVELKILEPTQAILEININVPNRTTAKWIFQKWKEKATQVYSTIYDLLVE